ncbi:MAG TPA: LuxR C-terminal-related transcriptional regulator [bacterium]|nr:LuxR C-terminal-related transcriptional regulator [bacterium]
MGRFASFLHSLEQAVSPAELKSRFMDRAGEALGSEVQALYFFGSQGDCFEEIHLRGIRESFVFEYEELRREGEPGFELLIRSRQPISDAKVYPGRRWKNSALYRLNGKYRMRHYLCSPILRQGRVIGMLSLGRSSEVAAFDRRDGLRAEAISRIFAERLLEVSGRDSQAEFPSSHSMETARLRAARALLRADLGRLEDEARSLPPEEAALWWQGLAANQVAPIDFFDRGSKRYVLLPLNGPGSDTVAARPLTAREREIVGRVAAGDANKVIAFDLGLSVSTVASHLASAMAKLGLVSRVQLVEKFIGRKPS